MIMQKLDLKVCIIQNRKQDVTPKQMLERLPIALAKVKARNNSGNLLNDIRQIVYSLHQSKTLLKKYTTT